MRAVGVTEFGGPEALQVLDLPEPAPGPGEVVIRVHAAAVNPTDTGLRAGGYGERLTSSGPPPYIPGMDAAGVVDAVGEGVSLAVGEAVMALVVPFARPHGGAYADRIVVPAASVVPVPAGADFAHAATLPMNGMTALVSLSQLALSPGDTLAVTGAAGAYGGYVVALARAAGLRVVADASEADEELVRRLGATDVVRRGDDVAERIRALVPDGVDGLADGAVQEGLVADAVRDGGGMAVIRGWDGSPGRGITVHKTMVFGYAQDTGRLEDLRKAAEDGTLELRVAATYPPEQAADAHRQLEAGGTRGRIVIDFS